MRLLLSVVCISLLGLFAYQVMSFPLNSILVENRSSFENNKESDILNSVIPELALLNDLSEYSEIIQRPLFAKDRKSANIKSTAKTITVNELENLVLIGTATSLDLRVGIIADTKTKETERVKVGQIYNNWKIVEIFSDHIVFKNKDLEYKLFLTPYSNKGQKQENADARSVKKSPIKIPAEEEKDPSYYEALDDDVEFEDELEAQDFSDEDYDDDELSEEYLKLLHSAGAKTIDGYLD